MFIKTYLKFYQEYFKMVCSVYKGIFSGIEFVKILPIGPFSQICSHMWHFDGPRNKKIMNLRLIFSLLFFEHGYLGY